MSKRVAIIGGGLSGLVAAYELRKADPEAEVTVYEAADRVGGKLRTVDLGYGPTDVGAEAYLAFRRDATEFFEELGLGDQLREPSGAPSSLWIGDGELHAMPARTLMGVPADGDAVKDLVDEETRQRIDAESEAAPIPWAEGEDASLGNLVAARMGQQVVDHVVSPLLGGVYSTRAEDLGLRATVPQLAAAMDKLHREGKPVTLTGAVKLVLDERAAQRKAAQNKAAQNEQSVPGEQSKAGDTESAAKASSGPKKPPAVFKSFVGGYGTLLDALVEKSQATIELNSTVTAVERTDEGFQLTVGATGNEQQGDFAAAPETEHTVDVDAVIVATPAPVAARQLASIAPVAADIVGAMDLASSVVVAMHFDDADELPEKSGILVSPDAGLKAKAFTFSSRKWPHLADQGGALVRASFGHYGDDSLVSLDEEELVEYACEDLERVAGITARPSATFLQRWWGGLPRYGTGHAELISVALADVSSRDGVEVAGAIWDGVGIPACIAQARKAATAIAEQLAK